MINSDGDMAEDKTVSSTGSYNASATQTYPRAWVMQMVDVPGQRTGWRGTRRRR